MTTSVYARQKEFATLESIGMTKKQILNTLSFEGLYYAVFSILLLLLLGIPFTYGLIQPVQKQFYFLTFQPPTGAVLLIIILVTAILCLKVRRTASPDGLCHSLEIQTVAWSFCTAERIAASCLKPESFL